MYPFTGTLPTMVGVSLLTLTMIAWLSALLSHQLHPSRASRITWSSPSMYICSPEAGIGSMPLMTGLALSVRSITCSPRRLLKK